MTSSSNENIHQKIRNEFPYDVKKLTDISIPVDKNIKSTATIWMHQRIFDDEYSEQELSDGLKILEWIQNQTWSNGKNLSGIISAYSTDDRYNNDIHYYGGCLAAQEALSWPTQMLILLSVPPHPLYQGGIDKDFDLINVWKERLHNLMPLDFYWIKHQNRNEYWRHGSVCEDYSKI
ncbi:unnamed protein product [Rotaria socialis]|uniref:Xaa-Pro dipeptidyl-peptidase-like domain-containing protein n=1 Tax=Rotaria socialis TaxID=392032 RepID=A0A820QWL1_9BILA|nr:unnamed protein product [Rotaria socialis]CAF4427866.1 unnamed protein product [Rotaria socialis]CAF4828708.1 unnamed protein product [Rotaria socialis]